MSNNQNFRYIEHNELYTDALLDALRGAKTSLTIATANLKATLVEMGAKGKHIPIAASLAGLAVKGIKIKLLYASSPSKPFMESLNSSGLNSHPTFQMQKCPRLHFKTIITDNKCAYIGSANLTGAGLGAKSPERRNFELGLIITEPNTLARIQEYFDAIWSGALCAECGQKKNCSNPIA